jgi:hypothetical protein
MEEDTITGDATSRFVAGDSLIESRVIVFAARGQASSYFEAKYNEAHFGCIRDDVLRRFRKAGLRPRVVYARMSTEPPVGARTVHYVIGFMVTSKDGTKQPYPMDFVTFQMERAVGVLQFNFIPSPDGSRPCQCELDHARAVASRLYTT